MNTTTLSSYFGKGDPRGQRLRLFSYLKQTRGLYLVLNSFITSPLITVNHLRTCNNLRFSLRHSSIKTLKFYNLIKITILIINFVLTYRSCRYITTEFCLSRPKSPHPLLTSEEPCKSRDPVWEWNRFFDDRVFFCRRKKSKVEGYSLILKTPVYLSGSI